MTLSTSGYIFLISTVLLLALFSVSSVVVFTNPNSSVFALSVFYISIFLAVTAAAVLAGVSIRYKVLLERFIAALSTSLRQGVWIGILIVASLMLQAEHLLYWWVELSIVLLLVVIEVLFNL